MHQGNQSEKGSNEVEINRVRYHPSGSIGLFGVADPIGLELLNVLTMSTGFSLVTCFLLGLIFQLWTRTRETTQTR